MCQRLPRRAVLCRFKYCNSISLYSSSVFPELRRASIQTRVKLLPVLQKLGIELSHGAHTQQIRCPFHDDRTPSARLYEDSQRIYCYTCGKGWDVIALVQGRLQLQHHETLDWFDQHFPPPNAIDDLTGTLSLLLNAPPSKQDRFVPLFKLVESSLIANRHKLGLIPYSKMLQGLDIIIYKRTHGQMEESEAVAYLHQILKRCS